MDCNSHRFDKLNYRIPHPNTRATRQHIEESLNFAEHGVPHTTYILPCFPVAHCKIATLLSQEVLGDASQYMDFMQCQSRNWQTWHPCSNIQSDDEGVLPQNNVEYECWFCHGDVKCCVSGSKKKYVLGWPIVPNTWLVKIGTNLSRDGCWRLRTPDSNCNRGRHFHLVGHISNHNAHHSSVAFLHVV